MYAQRVSQLTLSAEERNWTRLKADLSWLLPGSRLAPREAPFASAFIRVQFLWPHPLNRLFDSPSPAMILFLIMRCVIVEPMTLPWSGLFVPLAAGNTA